MIFALTLVWGALQSQIQEAGPAPRLPARRAVAPRTPPDKWVTFSQFPDRALDGHAFGRVRFRLDVDAAGQVSACHVLATSGYWILDEETCSILKHRASFVPALDADGKPMPATYSSAFTWDRGDQGVRQWEALMRGVGEPVLVGVSVKKLPASYRDPVLVRIRFDPAAKPVECRIEIASGSAAIDRAACAQVMSGGERAKGTPLIGQPDTRMFLVGFKAEPSG